MGTIALWSFFPPSTRCGISETKWLRFARNCWRRRSPAAREQKIQSRRAHRRRGRRRGGRVDEAAAPVDQQIDQLARAADVSAAAAERLAQRAHLHIDFAGEAELIRETASMLADHADSMRLIEEQHGAVAVLHFDDLRQVRPVAVHTENGLGHNDDARLRIVVARPLQMALELAEMVVRVNADDRAAELRAVDQRGVGELVENDDVVLAEQRAERADRRRVAGGKAQRRFRALELREFLLELDVWSERAADQPRGAAADAVLVDRRLRRFAQERLRREPEVVI
jgi:hypothetical protein